MSFRAYDMAAIKLKGYDRANTNFPKSQYHHEPFMVVCAQACPLLVALRSKSSSDRVPTPATIVL